MFHRRPLYILVALLLSALAPCGIHRVAAAGARTLIILRTDDLPRNFRLASVTVLSNRQLAAAQHVSLQVMEQRGRITGYMQYFTRIDGGRPARAGLDVVEVDAGLYRSPATAQAAHVLNVERDYTEGQSHTAFQALSPVPPTIALDYVEAFHATYGRMHLREVWVETVAGSYSFNVITYAVLGTMPEDAQVQDTLHFADLLATRMEHVVR